ncbi:Uncharacterised protein [Mycobacterium tuberculosis]|nr:Uncharacterised protein [Mycobacterium tuberculosis]
MILGMEELEAQGTVIGQEEESRCISVQSANGIELVRLDVRWKQVHDGRKFLVFVGCNDTSRFMKHKIGVFIALNDSILKKEFL